MILIQVIMHSGGTSIIETFNPQDWDSVTDLLDEIESLMEAADPDPVFAGD